MTARWGGPGQGSLGNNNAEGMGNYTDVCSNYTTSAPGGNTCTCDWEWNFFYGPPSGTQCSVASGPSDGGGHGNMYTYLTDCADRYSPCTALAATPIPICGPAAQPCLTLAATTDYPENLNAGVGYPCWVLTGATPVECWSLNLAANLPAAVALG